MKFERTKVWGFEHAIRGMRNPLESWDRSDSFFDESENDEGYDCKDCPYYDQENTVCISSDKGCPSAILGPNDIKTAQTLIRAGSSDRKFLRQIFVSVDITAPLYWWKEFDTYKVGTVANSTSTMHKMGSKPITLDCFEIDDLNEELLFDPQSDLSVLDNLIPFLENLRQKFNETKNKKYWKALIRWLPESWLQTRTVTLNYENLYSMIRQRGNHKLNEWSGKDNNALANFISWAKTLPYAEELIFYEPERKVFGYTMTELKGIIEWYEKQKTESAKIEESKVKSDHDPVNHPSHYTSGGIECIDAMIAAYGEKAVADFCMCNAFKYQWRFGNKNGVEDLKKAEWYRNKYMELKKWA